MKILHINCNYILSPFHQTMVEHLDDLGFENYVFVAKCKEDEIRITPNDNVTVSTCFNRNDRFIFFYKQKKIIKAIEKQYDLHQFDLIHAYTLFTDGNVARYLSQKYNIPYVVAVRNTDVNVFFKYRFYLRNLGLKILNDANYVFFLSNAYMDLVFKKYIKGNSRDSITKKVCIIPNGIDPFWFNNLNTDIDYSNKLIRISNKQIHIIFAGRIDYNKNILTTCQALDLLVKNGWKVSFDVVGRVEDESIIHKIKDYRFCNIIAQQEKEELMESYRNADVFVMPSFTETFGLVYVEAMTQGLPVIYSRNQGFDRQFEEGVVGYSVKSDSPIEIADRIIDICSGYESISKRCIELSKRYSWPVIINEYKQIYENHID